MIGNVKTLADKHLPVLGFLITFLISPWFIGNHYLLNSDGIFYLKLAIIFDKQGLTNLLAHYDWPFYPMLIVYLHRLSHLSYLASAYLIQGCLWGLATAFFIKIVTKLQGSLLTQWFALLVFLSLEPILNYYMDVFRDYGYWAFYLASVYWLLSFAETPNMRNVILWFFAAIMTVLFRIEGLVLLLLAPFSAFFFTDLSFRKKTVLFNWLYSPIYCILFFLCCGLLYFALKEQHLISLIQYKIYILLTDHLSTSDTSFLAFVDKFQNLVLPDAAKQGSASFILFIGLTGYLICKFFWTIGGLNALLIVTNWCKKLMVYRPHQKAVVMWLLVITFFIPYAFLFKRQFISTRYMMSTILTLLIFVPFALSYCATHLQTPLRNLFKKQTKDQGTHTFINLKLLLILYLLAAFGDFVFLASHFYQRNTLQNQTYAWLQKNKQQIPSICSSHDWPIYAVKGADILDENIISSWEQLTARGSNCQYFVLVASHSRQQLLQQLQNSLQWTLVQSFDNKHSEKNVYIFKHS